jgi:hypothetical protein
VFPCAGGFVKLCTGSFGFGGNASFEGEFFPFGELFLWWQWLSLLATYDDIVNGWPTRNVQTKKEAEVSRLTMDLQLEGHSSKEPTHLKKST